MNREEEIKANALEIAAIMCGQTDTNIGNGPNGCDNIIVEYLPLARRIEEYLKGAEMRPAIQP
jgi:hypothetical protein